MIGFETLFLFAFIVISTVTIILSNNVEFKNIHKRLDKFEKQKKDDVI